MALSQSNTQSDVSRPFLITFSGIDGAGKTTQIEYLSSYLEKQGLRVLLLSFWDHVAVLSRVRGGIGQRTIDYSRTDQATAPLFVPKNNKHIRKWYLTAARAGFYVLDVARLHLLLAGRQLRNFDVVIFDRYVYDQVANIDSKSSLARVYVKVLLKWAPAPDLAFVIDELPAAAFARKPEFPVEFVRRNREDFLQLRELVPPLIVTSPGKPEDVRNEICQHVGRSRILNSASTKENTETAAASTVVARPNSCSAQNHPTASI